MFEVNEGISRPELPAQLLPCYHLPRVFEQYRQNLEGLFSAELNPDSVFAQFPRRKIDFENAKADCPPRLHGRFHGERLSFDPRLAPSTIPVKRTA